MAVNQDITITFFSPDILRGRILGGLTMKRRKRSKMEAPEETGVASIQFFKILNFLNLLISTYNDC